jgi:N6-adenosine-specific RNA methylase IME4
MNYTQFEQIPRNAYQIIYADPAWTYNDKALAGNRGAGCKYSLMTDDDLYNLPVASITATNAVLFMWATFPKMAEALRAIAAWGFVYKTVGFTWVKRTSTGKRWFWGMGHWTRSNAEVCLLAVKGKPKRRSAAVHSVVDSPIGRHSAKPTEVRERIVKLVGELRRIELFARNSAPGWDAWGNEIDTAQTATDEWLAIENMMFPVDMPQNVTYTV